MLLDNRPTKRIGHVWDERLKGFGFTNARDDNHLHNWDSCLVGECLRDAGLSHLYLLKDRTLGRKLENLGVGLPMILGWKPLLRHRLNKIRQVIQEAQKK